MNILIHCNVKCAGGVAKKYRVVTRKKTAEIVKATGKIKPNWSEFHLAPSKNDTRSLLVHDIGVAVMTHVQMAAPTFNELETHQHEAVEFTRYVLILFCVCVISVIVIFDLFKIMPDIAL